MSRKVILDESYENMFYSWGAGKREYWLYWNIFWHFNFTKTRGAY
ncbi:MAG: hypothetical protein ACPLVJ_01190 [Candidatus Bathyarchaeales archaeon]